MKPEEMSVLEMSIKNIEPLHIGTSYFFGTFYPTEKYIPAKTLRGMLGLYLKEQREDLFEMFRISNNINPRIFFSYALPEGMVFSPAVLRWCKKCKRLIKKSKRSFSGETPDLEKSKEKYCSVDKHEGKKMMGLIPKELLKGEYSDAIFSKKAIKMGVSTKCPIFPETMTSYPEGGGKSP